MRERPDRIVLVFIDGVGIGGSDARVNPMARAHLPVIRELLGGAIPVLSQVDTVFPGARASLAVADATLGIPGRPQSGTGQTALLTGANAPALIGRHFGPWVPTALRGLLAEQNLLRRAADAGRIVAFANAYPAGFLEGTAGRRPRPAAPPLVADSVNALTRDASALRKGRAVASSITNEAWRAHLDAGVPEVTGAEAGGNLARIANDAELTLFAHYDTDVVGHRGDMDAAVAALERVDAFIGGLVGELDPGALVIVASDHGNIEDVSAGHTLNPVPVLAVGPAARSVAERVRAITDVTPVILSLLGLET